MKVEYKGIKFDSDLEVDYYKFLESNKDVKRFIYHPIPIQITSGNNYTPDFIVFYTNSIEIIETKGYNQFSHLRDSIIHNTMLQKSSEELKKYVEEALKKSKIKGLKDFRNAMDDYLAISTVPVVYKKIKYMKQFGWVEFNFKNPNTLAKKRKEKINLLEQELKELRLFKKDTLRYFKLCDLKLVKPKKITKSQNEFMDKYIAILEKEINDGTK